MGRLEKPKAFFRNIRSISVPGSVLLLIFFSVLLSQLTLKIYSQPKNVSLAKSNILQSFNSGDVQLLSGLMNDEFIEIFIRDFVNEKYLYTNQIATILSIQNYLKQNDIDFVDAPMENLDICCESLPMLKNYPDLNFRMLDTSNMIMPAVSSQIEPNCFIMSNGHLGHWNLKGNQIAAKLLIDKISERYGDNFN